MKLTFKEIEDWKEFENLTTAYFESIGKILENDVSQADVEPSGEGSDGGRDIFVKFKVFDSIITYDRKWVIQCKFYDKSVSKKDISTVNIPSLIHEYGADGYLLICKNGVTSRVSEMFENLRKNCRFGYSYMIWDGSQFIQKLISNGQIIEQYFPKYNKFKNSK